MKIKFTKVGRPTKVLQSLKKKADDYLNSQQYKIDEIKTAMRGGDFVKHVEEKINQL